MLFSCAKITGNLAFFLADERRLGIDLTALGQFPDVPVGRSGVARKEIVVNGTRSLWAAGSRTIVRLMRHGA